MKHLTRALDDLTHGRKRLHVLACYLSQRAEHDTDTGAAFIAGDVEKYLRGAEENIHRAIAQSEEDLSRAKDAIDTLRHGVSRAIHLLDQGRDWQALEVLRRASDAQKANAEDSAQAEGRTDG